MQKTDYQTRILKLEKTIEALLEFISPSNEDEEQMVEEAREVLYNEALDEEGDI